MYVDSYRVLGSGNLDVERVLDYHSMHTASKQVVELLNDSSCKIDSVAKCDDEYMKEVVAKNREMQEECDEIA